MILKEKIIKKTRKVHYCNSWKWIRNSDIHNIKTTLAEKYSLIKAKKNNGKIEIGSSCIYFVEKYDGEFLYGYCIPELHEICIKYELYQEP